MCRRGALILPAFFLLLLVFLLAPQSLLARGGHGSGITFPAGSLSSETADTTFNFHPYRHRADIRIQYDFNLLLSPEVIARIDSLQGDVQQGADNLLWELDNVQDNEFGLPYHDFALIYNYFARAPHPYGEWGDQQKILFNLGYPDRQENHVDLYLAGYGAELPSGWTGYYGIYPSQFWDWDEDSVSVDTLYNMNSLQDYDGPDGLDVLNPNWYKSGAACNLRFDHEYQHMCYRSNTGYSTNGWPNEFFSTAAEYLSGVAPDSSYFWEPINDLPCDQSLFSWPGTGDVGDARAPYPMWRLFAAYLLQQFNPDVSQYTDDLLYEWVREETPGHASCRGLYELSQILVREPWTGKLPSDSTSFTKLSSLFQDWSIAKAVDDTTRMAPRDELALGFGRGLSPYWDLGLFRDVSIGCSEISQNTGVLPNQHVLDASCLDSVNWVENYTDPTDSELGCSVRGDRTYNKLVSWSSDYILFKADSGAFEGSGPYDLKVLVRDLVPNSSTYRFPSRANMQVSVVTYSSADSVFRSGDDVIDVRKIDVLPGTGRGDVTVHGFGDPVKAVVLIVGIVGPEPTPCGDNGDTTSFVGWYYKYGYWVTPHWTSGPVSANAIWADSVHVIGDVTVLSDRRLSIEPGTRVEFYPGDTQTSGKDTTRCELWLEGWWWDRTPRVVANGSPGDSILFTSGASSPTNFDWYGVVQTGWSPRLEPSYCRFEHAAYPILCEGDTVLVRDTLRVNSCTFRDYGIAAIHASNVTVGVSNSVIDMCGAQRGAKFLGRTRATIEESSIYGCGGGIGFEASPGCSLTVVNSSIAGVSGGVYASGDTLSFSHDGIHSFQSYGISASNSLVNISYDTLDIGSTGVTGIELINCPSGDVSHNVIRASSSGLRYGMKCSGTTSGSVSYNKFENVLTGMKVYGSSDLDVTRNVFTDNGSTGISAEGSSSLDLTHNSITGYTYYGVSVKNTAHADMGTHPDSGLNRVFTSSQITGHYCVMNRTADSVRAEYNWWGTDDPYSQVLFYGKVDWVPYLTEDPGLPFSMKLPGRSLVVPAIAYTVQNYPNPMNPVTTIEYGVPENGILVAVRVFDITGRLVRTLVEGRGLAGVHTVGWDGCGEEGEQVASGVYLYEVVIGEYRVSKKMVVLR